MPATKVLIVDDSPLIRQVLADIFARNGGIEVVGSAPDPYIAWEKIRVLEPDVITLDVEMPKMDGITFLDRLMRVRPIPVVMISSLTERGAQATIRALELGAVDFVTKPKIQVSAGTFDLAEEIVEKVKGAARARPRVRSRSHSPVPVMPAVRAVGRPLGAGDKVICIGASTGGTEALYDVLTAMPADAPGIVIVQHMPAGFTNSFAQRLDGACQIHVKEAKSGDRILAGQALLAPGGQHMEIAGSGTGWTVRVAKGEAVNRHQPSVDVLFQSAARRLGPRAVGVLLTGMGNDGARGMLAMRQAGAHTIAEDESTCVVFGMPKEAIALGAAAETQPLHRIPDAICEASLAIAMR